MATKTKFKGTPSEMLISISALTNAGIQHKTIIVAERSIWADPFLPNLLADINTAISTYLGVDNAAQLREKTSVLETVRTTSYDHLTKIKNQINRDYRANTSRRDELYRTLGYTQNWSGARSKDQESTIDLLYAFKQNLTPAIKTELVAKGINVTRLDDIIAQAQVLLDANITQETAKKLIPTLTEATTKAFNDIYDRAMDVAIISRQLFKDPTIQDQFSYSKVLSALNTGSLTTKYDGIKVIQPGSVLTLTEVKLTRKSKLSILLSNNVDGVYACRNTNGCYPSESLKLTSAVTVEVTKEDLQGDGDYLIISNPLAEEVEVKIKIQG